MIDFDTVQVALEKLDANVDAAEAHGTLCGLLLDRADRAQWLRHTLDDLPDSGDVLAAEHLAVLTRLFDETREQVNNEDLSFELLLPDESDDFGVRLLGLSGWCQGFLYATGVTGLAKNDRIDELSSECLSDLLEISKLDYQEAGSEEAEQHFLEIAEHVRMSVLMLNEALNPVMPAPQLQ